MKPSRIRIVIVGGGSNAWTPTLVRDILLTESLAGRCDVVLYDIKKRRSDLTKRFCDKLAAELGVEAGFASTDQMAEAFPGADYFIITIATGGLNAMAHDLAIPEDYGIYHTVGDTSGPGGWARAVRNFGAFAELADGFNRHAPNAMVLNYSNPMTCLTDVLCRFCDAPVIGLCHGLFSNLDFIQRYYGLESEDEMAVQYAGINHFFFVKTCRAGGIERIADLRKRIKTQSLSELLRKKLADPMGFSSDTELATELFRLTAMMPYLGDRHTCEFLPGYITSKKNMRRYKLKQTSAAERKEAFRRRDQLLRQWIRGSLPDHLRRRSRETAADIIAAHAGGGVCIDVGNVPNVGQVASLPLGLVVETAVRVDQNGFSPIAFGELPEAALSLVEPYAHVFPMTVDACFEGDLAMAVQALRLDPVCSHLNGAEVDEMARRLLRAHRRFIRCF
jgi:alpha-galactosidase